MIYKIGDIGSCHSGKLEYAKEAIKLAKDSGLDCVKFQLFDKAKNGNLILQPLWLPELQNYANELNIDFLCSVFDKESFYEYLKIKPTMIKLAYSQNFNLELIKLAKKHNLKIMASGDTGSYPDYADIKLFCQPIYPVKDISMLTFVPQLECRLTDYFAGFSSHNLGIYLDVAIMSKYDWQYIEKHFTLDHDDINCPDNEFALSPKDLKKWVEEINKI